MTHLIILPVILPALLAPLLLFFRAHPALQRAIGLGTTAALLALSLVLWHIAAQGPQAYRLGDWPAPFGIVLILDRLAALMLILTALLALIVQIYVLGTRWDRKGRHFHALFLFQLMGLNGAFLTGDAFNLFVFFEVLLIASYGLMIHGGGTQRIRAGVQYVTYNLLASSLFLIALATLYGLTGTLNMADLGLRLAALPPGDIALARTAAVLLLLVFAIKAALVPLHLWLPNTYALAPGPIAALFAVMTKVGAYATLRTASVILPNGTAELLFGVLLAPAAMITLIVGAIGVLGAKSLARQAAFAAIASMGTVFIGISASDPNVTAATLYYVIHSTLAGALLFLITDQIQALRGTDDLTQARPPLPPGLAVLFFAAAIATAGMPPLSGFLGKLLILQALPDWTVWATILTGSLLLMLGLARSGSLLFWKAHETAPSPPTRAPSFPPLATLTMTTLVLTLMALTLLAGPIHAALTQIAQDLHDPQAYIAVNDLPALGESP
jgi:multicomponent K+:H+ antiporter subunit D